MADALGTIGVLRQSEEKFRRILANMPDVSWTSDQYGRMTYLSLKLESLFGYSSEEVRASGGDLWQGRIIPKILVA